MNELEKNKEILKNIVERAKTEDVSEVIALADVIVETIENKDFKRLETKMDLSFKNGIAHAELEGCVPVEIGMLASALEKLKNKYNYNDDMVEVCRIFLGVG